MAGTLYPVSSHGFGAMPDSCTAGCWPTSRASWVSAGMIAMLVGYLCGGRSFAHFGVGPLYVGELALLAFFVTCPVAVLQRGAGSLVRPTPLSAVVWCLYFFLLFGLVQCLRGYVAGYDSYVVIQNTVFHVYAVFLFAGVWLGCQLGEAVPRLVWFLATCHGVYGVAYVTVFSPLGLTGTGEFGDVPWFGQPNNSAVLLLVLLATERRPGRLWVPMLLNVFVLAAIQSRAEWLSLCVVAPLWGYLAGKTKQVMSLTLLVIAIVAAWAASGLTIPLPETRGGGEMGGQDVIGRIVAVVDPNAAAAFTDNVERQHGTAAWRVEWWSAIWDMVHESPVRMMVGPGYGHPIWDLHPEGLSGVNRTPHNGFVYALAYTGWAGLFLFSILQLTLGISLWKVYRRTGQPAGFCYWAMCLIRGSFDNFFESPHMGIPFYLIAGMFTASLLDVKQAPRPELGDSQASGEASLKRGANV